MANLVIIGISLFLGVSFGQLVVNVKNEGGEIFRESIQSNTTTDVIVLEFQKTDGTLVTQFIDYKHELQIFHMVVFGEQELGQPLKQSMCFLIRLSKNDFISADAMSKLRQKNPSAVRHPEEDRGIEGIEMDLVLSFEHAYIFSPHIQQLCNDARDTIYIRDKDLKLLTRSLNRDYTTLLGATKSLSIQRVSSCTNTTEAWRPCACSYHSCVLWYPCGLKYCKGKDSTGKTVSYRCGIKTCSKCRSFQYQARRRELCMWQLPDIPGFGPSEKDEVSVDDGQLDSDDNDQQNFPDGDPV